MRINKNFRVEEFVHPRFVTNFGKSSKWYVSKWQIETAIFIRSLFGDKPMRLNDWHYGGHLKNRGTRLPNSSVGSFYSQHKFANAIDFDIQGIAVETCFELIIEYQDELLKRGITTVESLTFTPTWIHLDGRQTGLDHMLVVSPRAKMRTSKKGFFIEDKFYYDE